MSKRYIWDSKTLHGQIYDKLTKKNLHGSRVTMQELNKIWEQTKRFEKHNRELIDENIRLTEKGVYCDNLCKSFRDYYGKDIENAEWYGYIKQCYTDNEMDLGRIIVPVSFRLIEAEILEEILDELEKNNASSILIGKVKLALMG